MVSVTCVEVHCMGDDTDISYGTAVADFTEYLARHGMFSFTELSLVVTVHRSLHAVQLN